MKKVLLVALLTVSLGVLGSFLATPASAWWCGGWGWGGGCAENQRRRVEAGSLPCRKS